MDSVICYGDYKTENIEYAESVKPYVKIHYIDGRTKMRRESLTEYEKNEGAFLIRTSRQYLVNLKYVREIGNSVLMGSGTYIAVSRRKKPELICKYKEYLL